MVYLHKNLAAGRWFELTLKEQMANIGAEVGRAVNWRQKGGKQHSRLAFERGLELFDLTLADPGHRHRYRELARAREVVCDFFVGNNEHKSTPRSLDNYFLPFAVAARRDRQI